MSYEPVIGLEIHVQLATETKMFCGDRAEFGAEPNTHVCPVCLGLPGALPVVNRRAVELAVRAALGLDCSIHESSVFARKNYFYPDLPKGYQITQYDRPLATRGRLAFGATDDAGSAPDRGGDGAVGDGAGDAAGEEARDPADGPATDMSGRVAGDPPGGSPGGTPGGTTGGPAGAGDAGTVRIRRIHLEEDAGKSLHDRLPGRTAVDLNRAGVPLAEIVTEPDLRSPTEARAFLTRLKQVLEYLEVSDCDMEKGSLRVDANVSVRPAGSDALGTKTELKNMNSFANVERALAHEVERQRAVLRAGGEVVHETRLWDERRGEARVMRTKEQMHDYRYFPDPDLPPLMVEPETIERIHAELPELPDAKFRRFREMYALPPYDAGVLTATRVLAEYYEAVARRVGDPKSASNWVMTEVLSWLNRNQCAIEDFPVPAGRLAELIGLVEDGTISGSIGKRVFAEMAETGRAPAAIVADEGLEQVRDVDRLEAWVDEVIAESPDEAARYRAGETRLLGHFMGRLMRKSKGKADPRKASELLRRRLGDRGVG